MEQVQPDWQSVSAVQLLQAPPDEEPLAAPELEPEPEPELLAPEPLLAPLDAFPEVPVAPLEPEADEAEEVPPVPLLAPEFVDPPIPEPEVEVEMPPLELDGRPVIWMTPDGPQESRRKGPRRASAR